MTYRSVWAVMALVLFVLVAPATVEAQPPAACDNGITWRQTRTFIQKWSVGTGHWYRVGGSQTTDRGAHHEMTNYLGVYAIQDDGSVQLWRSSWVTEEGHACWIGETVYNYVSLRVNPGEDFWRGSLCATSTTFHYARASNFLYDLTRDDRDCPRG